MTETAFRCTSWEVHTPSGFGLHSPRMQYLIGRCCGEGQGLDTFVIDNWTEKFYELFVEVHSDDFNEDGHLGKKRSADRIYI